MNYNLETLNKFRYAELVSAIINMDKIKKQQ